MKQCSPPLGTLPAYLALCCALGMTTAPPAVAQQRYRVDRADNFRLAPGPDGRLLASILKGAVFAGDSTRDGWVRVTVDGWIWAASVGPAHTQGYDVEVTKSPSENLRSAPNGAVVARLLTGFMMQELGRNQGWVHVERVGWMWGHSLTALGAVASEAAATPTTDASGAEVTPDTTILDRVVVAPRSPLLMTAGGDTLGVLRGETPARVLARSGEWARVRVDAWVRAGDIKPADEGVLTGVSGAEVRSRPDAFRGKTLAWTLQYISIQTADDLRRDMPQGRPYMLARGPLPETGFVYVVLTPAQADAIRRIGPLNELTVVGRVRTGRSQYLGNPVLDLIDFTVNQP
jgi:hypothetical protein